MEVGAEVGRVIEPSAFDVAINGSFAVADAPNGRERVQLFDASGVRTGGFLLPGRGATRVVFGSLSLNGVGTLSFTGRSIVMSQPDSGWLITEYGLAGTPMRTIGQLRRTGHESDRQLHLALNAGIPIRDPAGGFYFVFLAGTINSSVYGKHSLYRFTSYGLALTITLGRGRGGGTRGRLQQQPDHTDTDTDADART